MRINSEAPQKSSRGLFQQERDARKGGFRHTSSRLKGHASAFVCVHILGPYVRFYLKNVFLLPISQKLEKYTGLGGLCDPCLLQ